MMMKTTIILGILAVSLLGACREDKTFTQSPTERTYASIEALRTELSGAEHGWLMYYFPKTDSLLYSNVSVHLRESDLGAHLAGYGGFCYAVKFAPDGTLTMLGDRTKEETEQAQNSTYSLRPGSSTTLSFDTYNYIHQLVNADFEGRTDFVYTGKDAQGNLLFKTNTYIESAQEYICLKRIGEEGTESSIKRAYEYRQFFDRMKSPMLVIRTGDRIYFRSDRMPTANRSEIQQYKDKRYHLFLYAAQPSSYPGAYPLKVNGLGSGYVGTDRGLSFLSGIRFSKDYSFYHFERVGDKFVSRLVKTFDPIQRKYRYVSHLEDPKGEDTGVVAEVYDATP